MLPGRIYHIYNRGNNRENIFKDEKNYAFFLKRLDKYLNGKIEIHAYCLMPNHFHLLVRILEWEEKDVTAQSNGIILTPAEKGFKDFFISYAKAINRSYGRTGSLFQYKFKRKLITGDLHYANNLAYIHFNPPKAKLVSSPCQFRYSSYNAFFSKNPSKIRRDEVLDWFGGVEDFEQFHKEYWKNHLEREGDFDLNSFDD